MTEDQAQVRLAELEAEIAAKDRWIAAAERWLETLEDLKQCYGVGWMHQSNQVH